MAHESKYTTMDAASWQEDSPRLYTICVPGLVIESNSQDANGIEPRGGWAALELPVLLWSLQFNNSCKACTGYLSVEVATWGSGFTAYMAG